ncbi:MAG: glycosyltransferase family 39 protein [Flavobacteriales bacterium]|nr:glycosyltransferase family 39 protein [Flavobacteriales bacterium]
MVTEQPNWRERLRDAATTRFPGDAAHRWAFIALLLLAAVLRLWDLPHIPFTHDEISALVRVYPSLGGTVTKGVIDSDTHPPGVQVFEWAWTKLFGMGEAAVKLPFIVMALLALFLLYRFASAWCGVNVAIIATALLATLQYTVMYGQIARPYAAGFFTTALLADQLSRYLGSGSRRALVGTGIAALLSAYTHHFALMLAVFMLLTGLFLIDHTERKEYLVMFGAFALLYLPNIPILLKQFGQKGLEDWLATPTTAWVPDHLWWIAHCSVAFASALLLLILTSAILRIKNRGNSGPMWAITFIWGLLPLIVGLAYSIFRAPVIQYSVLLFSFPYLLIGTLAGLRHLRSNWALPIAFATAALAVFTLITVRLHYDVFYRSKYEAAVRGIVDASKSDGRLALVDVPKEIPGFYFRQWGVDSTAAPYINLRLHTAGFLDSVLMVTTAKELFYAASVSATPEDLARIQQAFPFMLERHDMEEGQSFLFSGIPTGGTLDDLSHISIVTPEALKGEGWTVDGDLVSSRDTTDRSGRASRTWDLDGREFGVVFERSVFDLASADNDVIEAQLGVLSAAPGSELKLVMELKEGDRSVFYRNSGDRELHAPGTLYAAIPLADLPQHGQGARLKVYLWNPGGKPAKVASMALQVREGNPWLYGFFRPLKEPLRFP